MARDPPENSRPTFAATSNASKRAREGAAALRSRRRDGLGRRKWDGRPGPGLNAPESSLRVVPCAKYVRAARRAGAADVLLDQRARRRATLGRHELWIEPKRQDRMVVEHVELAAAHPGRNVRADLAEHDHGPGGHVLARMIAGALDDCRRARVANGEPLAGATCAVERAAGGAVENGVAEQDGVACVVRRRSHDD